MKILKSVRAAAKPTSKVLVVEFALPETADPTPAHFVDLNMLVVLDGPEVKGYMANASIEALGSSPAEFGAFFRAERDTWAKVIKDTGAKLD